MTPETICTIHDIEALSEPLAADMAEEVLEVKGHTLYLIDFGDTFGYSRVVFKDGRHIYHANDYQLHHPDMSSEELWTTYVAGADNILFTPEELVAPLKSYDDYVARSSYLRDCYSQLSPHVSIFGNARDYEKYGNFEKYVSGMIYDPVAFAYYDDAAFVREHMALSRELDARMEEVKDNFEYQKSAFLFEMHNHEYGINWQADWDVLSVFGNIPYYGEYPDELWRYFAELHFTDIQKRAYLAARKQYFEETRDWN